MPVTDDEVVSALRAHGLQVVPLSMSDMRKALEGFVLARKVAFSPVGTVYTGTATRDGFRVVWVDGHAFPDGATELFTKNT
jgi:hypothetical protein